MRIWAAATVAIAAMTVSASPSFAARPGPLRSGTITGWDVWGWTWAAGFDGEGQECDRSGWIAGGNPECSAWLKSGCNPALAGHNPAVTASIVDITNLADGTTPRVFHWRGTSYPQWEGGGGVVIQLWRKDCTEIGASRWRSSYSYYRDYHLAWTTRTSTTFSIPSSARWMTVITNDSPTLRWTLR